MASEMELAEPEPEPEPERERDRRELLRRGLGLGGAAFAAASIPLLWSVRNAFAQDDTDGTILASAITLERVTVIAYDSVLTRGVLTPGTRDVLRGFRAHEQQHVDVLTTALTDLGGSPPAETQGVADVDEVAKGLGAVRSQAAAIRFLIDLEMAAVAAYFDAHSKLGEAKLLQTGASIMANEGQHLAVLRSIARQDPVPNAFETGAK
ncbi:MAG: hypothetical protein QOI64_1062 [Solirubrobacteraceae bacterium]|jgi:rubrerythrin|nr:hypothetical protein [Solirubrobacteraceae bacterium]